MTLGILFTSGTMAGIVTDRRLSSGEEEANKGGYVELVGARATYSFAGLAIAGGGGHPTYFEADRWIASALLQAAEPGRQLDETLRRFAELTTRHFRTLPVTRANKRFTLALAGFRWRPPLRHPVPFMAMVSNFENIEGWSHGPARDGFDVQIMTDIYCSSRVIAFGSGVPTMDELGTVGHQLNNEAAPPRHVIDRCVEVIRSVAGRDPSVGMRASSSYMTLTDGSRGVDYHPDGLAREMRVPATVYAVFDEMGAFAMTRLSMSVDVAGEQTITRVQKVGRNHPCPCGSGEKYKFCHDPASRQPRGLGDKVITGWGNSLDFILAKPPVYDIPLMVSSVKGYPVRGTILTPKGELELRFAEDETGSNIYGNTPPNLPQMMGTYGLWRGPLHVPTQGERGAQPNARNLPVPGT